MKVFRFIPELRILRLTFHKRVSLKIPNEADSYSFFDLFSFYRETNDHLNLKLLIFVGILQVLRYDFKKFRISKFLTFCHAKTDGVKTITGSFLCVAQRSMYGA